MFETIAFGSSSTGTTNSASSITFSHTTSGANRYLFVAVATAASAITGVTYNGSSMTKLNGLVSDSFTVWGIAGPTSGANNVVVSLSGSSAIRAIAHSFNGANQTGNPRTTASHSGSGSSVNHSITTVIDNSWVAGFCRWDISGGQSQTATSGATQRGTFAGDTFSNSLASYDSNSAKTPAGSYNMQLGLTGGIGNAYYFQMYELSPAPTNTGASLMAQLI